MNQPSICNTVLSDTTIVTFLPTDRVRMSKVPGPKITVVLSLNRTSRYAPGAIVYGLGRPPDPPTFKSLAFEVSVRPGVNGSVGRLAVAMIGVVNGVGPVPRMVAAKLGLTMLANKAQN